MSQQGPSTSSKRWPERFLRIVNRICHNPLAGELPCSYKFAVLYRGDVIETEMDRGPNAGTFDTLEEATQVALELFTTLTQEWREAGDEGGEIRFLLTDDWMRLVDDEIGEPLNRAMNKEINWNINPRGLLSMAALDSTQMHARVVVCDFQVEEEED